MNANFFRPLWFAGLLGLGLCACTDQGIQDNAVREELDQNEPRYLVGADMFPVAEEWGAVLLDSIYALAADSATGERQFMSLWNQLPTGDSLAVELAFVHNPKEAQKGKEREVVTAYFEQDTSVAAYDNVQFIDGRVRVLFSRPVLRGGRLEGVWCVRFMRWALVSRMAGN